MRFCLFILVFLITLHASGQLTPEVQTQLRAELAAQINAMRKEKQLPPLAFDAVLKQAAEVHSTYMAQKRKLTHDEDVAGMKSPKMRVVKQGGRDFELIGENVLLIKAPSGKPVKADCAQLAKDMAQVWRKSPGHYANMINANYTLGDLGFAMDTTTGTIYATQVFGKRGTVIANQLSDNAFGITQAEANCQDRYEGYVNLVYNLGNDTRIVGNEIKLYLSDRQLFDKIFPGANDGIAVDLMRKSQFPCGKENVLDFSPVYDGIMLKPIFRKELLAGNEAESDYRFVVTIGTIPEKLNPADYEVSVILIKDRKACMNIWPVCVPKGRMDPLIYATEIYDPKDVLMERQGIIQSVEMYYDFSSSDTVPKVYPLLPVVKGSVASVYIHSYTSVDGDSTQNFSLQQSRARAIRRHLEKKLVLSDDQIHIDARENWELMHYQLMYYGLNALGKKSQNQIRKEYASWDMPWKQLFAEQRRSSATINYFAVLPENAPQKLVAETNLRTALLKGDWERANKAMALLHKEGTFPEFLLDEPYFAIIKKQPELIQNVAALLALNPGVYQDKVGQCLNSWLGITTNLSAPAKRNILYLYALTYNEMLKVWDLPAQYLSNVLKPERMMPIKNSVEITDEVLLFDLHLTFIEYYGQINDSKGIDESFNYLVDYFDKQSLPLEDQVELCRFYNNWSRYDLTVDRLSAIFKTGKLNADGVLMLLETMTMYPEDQEEGLYQSVLASALKMAPKAFCRWVNGSFEVLRLKELKDAYCKTCGGK